MILFFQKMIATTVITPMHTVKILALNAGSFELNTFVDILKCFPCLQKLYFTVMKSSLILVFSFFLYCFDDHDLTWDYV
jgi:hypothetical protein